MTLRVSKVIYELGRSSVDLVWKLKLNPMCAIVCLSTASVMRERKVQERCARSV